MTRELGTALLGCGRIAGWFHLPILRSTEGLVLRAIAEPASERRADIERAAPGVPVLDDWRAAIDHPGVDAVVITLPNGLHSEAACAALAAGKHVYLEKPVAVSLEDGLRVRDAWRHGATIGMTGFQQRFDPLVQRLRRALAEGALGEVTGARILLGSASRTLPEWKRTRATGGGALLDLGSHAADLARFLFDSEVRQVSATIADFRNEADTAAMTMTLADGRLVQVHLTTTAVQESRVEVLGDGGRLEIDRFAGTMVHVPALPPGGLRGRVRRGLGGITQAGAQAVGVLRSDRFRVPYVAAFRTFADAARDGRAARPDLDDGIRSLAVIAAAEESAAAGRPVPVAETGP